MKHLVVVGGSDAGVSASLRAKELDPSVDVTMVVADEFPNYSICGLPMFLGGEVGDWRKLAHRSEQELAAAGIDVRLNTRATLVDPERQVVRVEAPTGAMDLAYDDLIIATGAEPVRPAIPGLDLSGVFLLHHMGDGLQIDQFIRTQDPQRAVIVGGGYIGCEMADALTRRGLAVTLMEQAPAVLPTVDPAFGQRLGDRMDSRGVEVLAGVRVQAIEKTDRGLRVIAQPDIAKTADLVIVVVGVRPVTGLAEAIGIPVGTRGAIQVNREMQTVIPHVWAAGDCVETWHRILGRPTYLPLGTTAHKQGRIAGENVVGGHRIFQGTLGTQVVKVFDTVVGRTGLTEEEAKAAGWGATTSETNALDHKAYYPGALSLHIRLVAERGGGRLLGGQILGSYPTEVSKRIDIVAVALYHEMSVDGASDLDLSYTPPLSSPWDPVQMAAQAWRPA